MPPRRITAVWARPRARRPSASSRSRPWAITFAIIESNSAGTTSPSATPASTRTPGPPGRRSRATVPGAGAKPASASSALRRTSIAWPAGERRLAGEAAAPRHVHLQLHEVEAGGDLRDAVLHLEPRVGLEEPEVLAGRVVEELHGRRADVARGPDEARRRLRASPPPAPRAARAPATPRRASGVAAGWTPRARAGPRRRPTRRSPPARPRGALRRGAARGTPWPGRTHFQRLRPRGLQGRRERLPASPRRGCRARRRRRSP